MRYKPTRAATSTAAAVENDAPGGGVEGQEGDAEGGDGKAVDLTGEGEEGEKSAAAPTVGVAKTGLGEPMEAFFQRGAADERHGRVLYALLTYVRHTLVVVPSFSFVVGYQDLHQVDRTTYTINKNMIFPRSPE